MTAFLFDEAHPSIAATRRAFPFEENAGGARMRSRARPTAAVAYPRSRFFSMIEAAGLRVQCMEAGFFPGGERLAGQDLLLLGH